MLRGRCIAYFQHLIIFSFNLLTSIGDQVISCGDKTEIVVRHDKLTDIKGENKLTVRALPPVKTSWPRLYITVLAPCMHIFHSSLSIKTCPSV